MNCQVNSWSLTELISSYFDLLIIYIILSCSLFSFFITKFLSIFGLSLPCPCNHIPRPGPGPGPCFRKLLLDYPTQSLSSLHYLIKTKFFSRNDQLELEHEQNPNSDQPSYTSFSDRTATTRTHYQRPCRGRRASLDYGKRSSVPRIRRSPSDPGFEADDENISFYDNAASFDYRSRELGSRLGFDGRGGGGGGGDENVVAVLEQALEAEQSARAALCAELEQERAAAATAADEAMAMISRLQEEKSLIEIEARQYQRILEEKSDYDAEEMNILKEIIVRREMENHFLEKEIEEYKKRLGEHEGTECQLEDIRRSFEAFEFSVDPFPRLLTPQFDESADKQGNAESIEQPTSVASLSEQLPIEESGDGKTAKGKERPESLSFVPGGEETNQEIQEKGIVLGDEMLFNQLCKSNNSRDHEFCEDGAILVGGFVSDDDEVVKTDQRKDVQIQISEPHVLDVHIVASKCNSCDKSTEKRVDSLMFSNDWNFAQKCDSSSEDADSRKVRDSSNGNLRLGQDIISSSSDMIERFSSLSNSPSRSVVSERRRNSLSAVDQERLKNDSEIGCLRTRLRAVRKEKEKLKNSLGSQERGKTEVQLLEDISALLREIRRLREPKKAARQASLPPLSSKETSKRRRSRSTSIGVGQSGST